METLAVRIVEIFPMHRLASRPASFIDADIIAKLLELPQHLRARDTEQEGTAERLSLHPCLKAVLDGGNSFGKGLVGCPFLVMAFGEAHKRTERH